MIQKNNIILADCCPEEVATFAEGCNSIANNPFKILSSISNWGHGGFIPNLRRYTTYFTFPFKIFLNRDKYNVILGWQQFYAINFALFCRLFHVRKRNVVIAANFTYKRKKGFIGKLYRAYMKFSCDNKYVDYFHVPSHNYVSVCCKELKIDESKFIVTRFGIPDTYEDMKNMKVPIDNYSLSIGRSNRDFDFLVNVWKQDCLKDKILVIASDTWKPSTSLPENILYRNDIKYEESFAWINCCNLCITSIDDGSICSGDTVLLTGMMFAKPVVVTTPSTLAEMYVTDNENGMCISKDIKEAARKISNLLENKAEILRLGNVARKSFVSNYSRYSMGSALCLSIKEYT